MEKQIKMKERFYSVKEVRQAVRDAWHEALLFAEKENGFDVSEAEQDGEILNLDKYLDKHYPLNKS